PVPQRTRVEPVVMDSDAAAQVMSANPAGIYIHPDQRQLTDTGGLVEGALANSAVYDPAHRFVVNPINHPSKPTNSPYRGMELVGKVTNVLYRGHQVVADANISSPYQRS